MPGTEGLLDFMITCLEVIFDVLMGIIAIRLIVAIFSIENLLKKQIDNQGRIELRLDKLIKMLSQN